MRDTKRMVYRDNGQTDGAAGSMLAVARWAFVRMLETLLRWQELSAQRRRLLELDARMLKDIGISRADAMREAHRSFWDDPARQGAFVDDRPGIERVSTCCQH